MIPYLNHILTKFDLWDDRQRKWFLLSILSRSRPSQICFVENALDQIGVSERKDFTRVLPKYLSLLVFSYLSAQDLSRCAQVSSHWKFLSEQVTEVFETTDINTSTIEQLLF